MKISLVINCHNEDQYIYKTLLSLDCAIVEGEKKDFVFEVIFVIDNGTEGVSEIVRKYCDKSLLKTKIVNVEYGSLGLSRNVGISNCTGDYIAVADADDLISRNYFCACVNAIKEYKKKHNGVPVVLPQFVYSFGEIKEFRKFYPSNCISPCEMISFHPYTSRIFVEREFFCKYQYQYKDLNAKSGFAFEDWDLNLRAYYGGHDFILAEKAILFYRKRQGSIMLGGDYIPILPYSEIMSPTALKASQSGFVRPPEFFSFVQERLRDQYLSDDLQSLINEARKIEETIPKNTWIFAKNIDNVWMGYGRNFFSICSKLNFKQFKVIVWCNRKPKIGSDGVNVLISDLIARFDHRDILLVVSNSKVRECLRLCNLPILTGRELFSKSGSKVSVSSVRALMSLLKIGGKLYISDLEMADFVKFKKTLMSRCEVVIYNTRKEILNTHKNVDSRPGICSYLSKKSDRFKIIFRRMISSKKLCGLCCIVRYLYHSRVVQRILYFLVQRSANNASK